MSQFRVKNDSLSLLTNELEIGPLLEPNQDTNNQPLLNKIPKIAYLHR